MIVKQAKMFGDIELDVSEPDSVMLWQRQGEDSNVIFIDREQLEELIDVLKKQLQNS